MLVIDYHVNIHSLFYDTSFNYSPIRFFPLHIHYIRQLINNSRYLMGSFHRNDCFGDIINGVTILPLFMEDKHAEDFAFHFCTQIFDKQLYINANENEDDPSLYLQ